MSGLSLTYILPRKGRGTIRRMVEGGRRARIARPHYPSTTLRAVPLSLRGRMAI